MEITHLRHFVETAEKLHFARAAMNLGITQPSLSRSIACLEKELGARLFSRSNKWRVSLTGAGKVFLPEARRMLEQLRHAENIVRAAGNGEYGRLRVGAISSVMGNAAFIDALADMRVHCPRVSLEIVDSTSAGLMEHIRNETMELVFLRLSEKLRDDGEFICEKICDDELAVALPRRHRLAKRVSFPVSALSGERFILVPESSSKVFHDYVCGFCEKEGGFVPVAAGEVSSSYTALRLVCAGLGIAVVSTTYRGLFQERLVYRRFSSFNASLPVYAVRRADNASEILPKFLSILKSRLSRAGTGGGESGQ